MTKLAIIHTTPATVGPLKELAEELIAGVNIVNFVDDSILPQLAEHDGDLSVVSDRLLHYMQFAEDVGADIILNACSSVGELVQKGRQQVSVPIVRIDEAMAERAVQRGDRIGVAATLQTTLNPTLRLIREKAREAGKEVSIETRLVAEAYRRLMAGDPQGHDEALAAALTELAQQVDVVVLAQASMARVVPRLPQEQQEKFFTSPRLGMERVRQNLPGQ